MVIPIHWNGTYFIFVVGFAKVGEARIGDQYSITWVPETHLHKIVDGDPKISDNDGGNER